MKRDEEADAGDNVVNPESIAPSPAHGGKHEIQLGFGNLVKDVGTLASTSTVAQGLRILAIPLLARLFSPADFGVLQVFMSLLGSAGLVCTLGYDRAIVLASSEKQAVRLFLGSCALSLCFALLVWLVLVVAQDALVAMLGLPDLAIWLDLLPPGIALIGCSESAKSLAARQGSFANIGKASLFQVIIGTTIQAVIGMLKLGHAGGLIIGRVGGIGVYMGTLIITALRDRLNSLLSEIRRPRRIFDVLKENRRFPLEVAPADVFSQAAYVAPVLLIALNFSAVEVGFFGVCVLLVSAPLQLIGTAMGQVFYSHAAEEIRQTGSAKRSVVSTFVPLALLGLVIGCGVATTAIPVIQFTLGNDWRIAGQLAVVISPMVATNIVSVPLTSTLIIFQQQRVLLMLQATRSVFSLATIYFVGMATGDLITTTLYYGLVEMFFHLSVTALALKFSGVTPRSLLRFRT